MLPRFPRGGSLGDMFRGRVMIQAACHGHVGMLCPGAAGSWAQPPSASGVQRFLIYLGSIC